MAEYLSPRERALIQKFSENPIDFFTGETRGWLEDFLKTSSPTGAAGTPSSALTGDYKISAQTATHTDSSGTWYLCDGSALPAEEAELIVLIGSNVPDARGRTLTMLGTHVDVNLVGDNEGIGTVANRRPKHGHSRAGSAAMTGANSTLALSGSNSSLSLTGSNSSIGMSGSNSSLGLPSGIPFGTSLLGIFNTTGSGTAWSGGTANAGLSGGNSSLSLTGANSSIGMTGSNSSLSLTGANSTIGVSDTITIGPDTNDQGAFIVPGSLFIHS